MVERKEFNQATLGFGYRSRAIFATDPACSKGRLYDEPQSPTRTPFQRDRDRIIHSNAFRRLKHKTQVFIADESDHYRTRLTHTIEVSQIARALARALRLDEDLAEAIALVHDFGHPPFGHAGENILNHLMQDYGGFDHNAQALRIVTKLENRYPNFDGLNLSWETLEGLIKHNGPLKGPNTHASFVPDIVHEFNTIMDLKLDCFPGPEAQCAAIADDIAYNAHDIDDGLRSGLITIEELSEVTIVRHLLDQIKQQHPGLDAVRTGYEIVRRQITVMVEDVIKESNRRLQALAPQSVLDIYRADKTMVCFSKKIVDQEKELKRFLYNNLYFHSNVIAQRQKADTIVTKLFKAHINDPQKLPVEWQTHALKLEGNSYARLVSDFLSGMTDTYAIKEYKRLFDGQEDFA